MAVVHDLTEVRIPRVRPEAAGGMFQEMVVD